MAYLLVANLLVYFENLYPHLQCGIISISSISCQVFLLGAYFTYYIYQNIHSCKSYIARELLSTFLDPKYCFASIRDFIASYLVINLLVYYLILICKKNHSKIILLSLQYYDLILILRICIFSL